MMLSYYTKICIPIIGINLRYMHYEIKVNSTTHEHITQEIKIYQNVSHYYFIINSLIIKNPYNRITLSARSPPYYLEVAYGS